MESSSHVRPQPGDDFVHLEVSTGVVATTNAERPPDRARRGRRRWWRPSVAVSFVVIGAVIVIAGMVAVRAAMTLLGVVLIAAGWCVAAGFAMRSWPRTPNRP